MKIERELEYQKKEGANKIADYAAIKIGQSVDTYFPRFVLLEDSVQSLQENVKSLENQAKNNRMEQNMQQQIDILKREFEQQKIKVNYLSEPNLELIQLKDLFKIVQQDIEFFKGKFKSLATSEKMEQIEFSLRSFVHVTRFHDLEDSLRKFSTIDDYKKLSASTQRLTEQFNSYVTEADFEEILQKLKAKIASQMDEKVPYIEFKEQIGAIEESYNQKFKQIFQAHDQFNRKFMKVIKDIADLKEEIKFIYQSLDHKIEHDETDKIWSAFSKYTTYDDFKDLYQKCLPEIQKFENRLIEYSKELENTRIIVRKFDETICDKASKQNIKEIYDYCKQYQTLAQMEDFKIQTNGLYENNKSKIVQLEDMIDILGKQISKDIYAAVRKAVLHVASQSDAPDSLVSNSRVTDELRQILAKKADKNELVEMNSLKSNKVDTEMALRWIDIMHKQMKQMLVLMIEKLRLEIDKKQNDSEHNKTNQKIFLFQQALLISQWINRFDSQNVNEYYESNNKIPQELVAFQRYAEESLGNIDQIALSPNYPYLNSNIKHKSKSLSTSNRNSIAGQQNQPSIKITNNKVTYGVLNRHLKGYSLNLKRQNSQDGLSGIGNANYNTFQNSEKKAQNNNFDQKKHSIQATSDITAIHSHQKDQKVRFRNDVQRKFGVKTALSSPRAETSSTIIRHSINTENNFTPQMKSKTGTLRQLMTSQMDPIDEFKDIDNNPQVNLPGIYK